MNYFPASSSILSKTHLNTFLKGAYNLSDDTNCSLIKAGINHTYALTGSSGKYIFRLYSHSWRTEKEIMEEIRLLEHLRASNIPVSYAIPDINGSYIRGLDAIEGKRPGVLFSYAAGDKIIHFSDTAHFTIGELMARFHKNTQNFKLDRVTYRPEVLFENTYTQLKQHISPDTDEMKFIFSTTQYLAGELKKVNTADLRHGVIHMDMWFDNVNVNANNEITIFDFDFCGNGWQCCDVAYYVMHLFFIEADPVEYATKTAHFLRGYESAVPLSTEEKRIIPLLGTALYFFYLGIQCQRFDDWSNVFISDAYLKRFIEARVKKYFDFTAKQYQSN